MSKTNYNTPTEDINDRIKITNKLPYYFLIFFILIFGLIASISHSDAVTYCETLCHDRGQNFSYKPTKCVCHSNLDMSYNPDKIEEIFINVPLS